MNYTVSDLYSDYQGSINLIAGAGGLARPITRCGILDYEMARDARERYLVPHFKEGQFVITSALYARDEPYQLIDAVKHLISKGCSGLLIKNVFRLPIHDSVIRYADFNNFPIFLQAGDLPYMEDLIYEVTRRVRDLSTLAFAQEKLAHLVSPSLSEDEVEREALALCPSLVSQFFTVYVRCAEPFADAAFARKFEELSGRGLLGPGTVLSRLRGGYLLIRSGDHISEVMTDQRVDRMVRTLTEGMDWISAGVSALHLRIAELPQSIRESVYAAIQNEEAGGWTRFGDLGLSRLLFFIQGQPAAASYRDAILTPVAEYDIETGSRLMETLRAYVDSGCSMEKAAAKLGQHVNTVRYRMEKVASLTGLNYRDSAALTELTVAISLRDAADKVAAFGRL